MKDKSREEDKSKSGAHIIKIASYSMERLANVSSNLRKDILK